MLSCGEFHVPLPALAWSRCRCLKSSLVTTADNHSDKYFETTGNLKKTVSVEIVGRHQLAFYKSPLHPTCLTNLSDTCRFPAVSSPLPAASDSFPARSPRTAAYCVAFPLQIPWSLWPIICQNKDLATGLLIPEVHYVAGQLAKPLQLQEPNPRRVLL